MIRLRLAHWIVDRYPRGWRDRYRDEVHDLLNDGPVTWPDVVDLWRGCLSEWTIATADPERNPVAFQFLNGFEVLTRKLMLLLTFVGPTVGTAWWLRARFGPPPDWVANLFFVMAFAVMGIVFTKLFRGRPWSSAALIWWVPLLAAAMTLAVWVDGLPTIRVTPLRMTGFLSLYIAAWFMSAVHQPRFMTDLVNAMGGRRYLLRWAHMELARCLSLPEKDPSRAPQLASAQAEVDRLERELQQIYTAIRERRPLPSEPTQASGSEESAG